MKYFHTFACKEYSRPIFGARSIISFVTTLNRSITASLVSFICSKAAYKEKNIKKRSTILSTFVCARVTQILVKDTSQILVLACVFDIFGVLWHESKATTGE